MKRQLVVACAVALFAASPALAVNGNIGIFADTGLAACQTNLPCGGVTILYVYGLLAGASNMGIRGAEYGIAQSNPGDYTFGEASGAGINVTIGSSTQIGGGIVLGYPACETGTTDMDSHPGSAVLLQRLVVQAADCPATPGENRLTVIARNPPTNQYFRCPLFVICDADFSLYCLGQNVTFIECPFPPAGNFSCLQSSSGEFLLNPGSGSSCTVAVQDKTWSGMKELYK